MDAIKVIREMEVSADQYSSEGHVPFVYAIVFEDRSWYIGCKYSNNKYAYYGQGGISNPSMLLNGSYNSCSTKIREMVESGIPHTRHIISIGSTDDVIRIEKDLISRLWDYSGRLNGRKGLIPKKRTPKEITESERLKIESMVEAGEFFKDIDDAVQGASRSRIRKYISSLPIDTVERWKAAVRLKVANTNAGWTQERLDELRVMLEGGVSLAAAARHFAVTPNTIDKYRQRWSIPKYRVQ